MGLLILFDAARSWVLWLLLLAVLLLTLWECRERGYRLTVMLWWMSFVALTHAVGYLILRLVRPPRKDTN
ncbi:MAG: hypothetical protein KTU85_06810 [Acidimicrobiia bacterium]|nr:hypothetical protein [Acidimicrobiia bacterium]MCY4457158.1 hypothetical protein [Acidimicrobiaceae bacterium]